MSFRSKGKRRKEENELMETTLGMLHHDKPPPETSNGHNTLPSRWQPGRQLQPPRSPVRPSQQMPPAASNVRGPGQSPYRNGSLNKPRPGYYSSLSNSSNTSLPRPGGGGYPPTSPTRLSPGMRPESPSSVSSNDSRRYRTWSPAAPMGTMNAPATLNTDLVTPKVSANYYSQMSSGMPGAPVPLPDHIDGRPSNPLGKPLLKPDQPPKQDKTSIRKQFIPPEKKGPTKYHMMQNFHLKESCYQRHKCRICLILLLLLLLLIFIILFTIGYGYNFFTPAGNLVPAFDDNCTYTCDNNNTYPNSPLIVIALDGFRYDYLETFHNSLPNIITLAECGAAGKLLSSFPATTSPNLRTIITGKYPQSHGIMSESMTDHESRKHFNPRENPNGENNKDAFWFPDLSIWEIARRQGKVTASQQWLGDMIGEVDDPHVPGKKIDRGPSYVDHYVDSARNYTARLNKVVEWLKLPIDERPELTTIYFEDPGITAREFGAESEEVRDKLEDIDFAIGFLRQELMKVNALGCVNIMVISTSGIADVSCDRVYYLTSDFEEHDISHWDRSAEFLASMSTIGPKNSAPDEFDSPNKIVDRLTCEVNNGQPYLRDLLPSRLHGSYGDRLNDIVVLMDEGHTFAGLRSGHNAEYCRGADDGYDPFLDNMKGVFIGSGRNFKLHKTVKPFQNVDLFNLMSDLIGLEPWHEPKQEVGSKGTVYDALKTPPALHDESWHLIQPEDNVCLFPISRKDVTAGCTCTPEELNEFAGTEGISFVEMDEHLNIRDVRETTQFNAPLGIPGVRDHVNKNGEYYCVLYQDTFITTYDRFLKIPTSVSYTLGRSNRKNNDIGVGTCIRFDQRLEIETTVKCSDFSFGLEKYQNITTQNLYKPSLAPGYNTVFDSQITSNVVPQYRDFATRIWNRIYDNEIWNWIDASDQVNTVMGPAYDLDGDSWKDSYYQLAESLVWVGNTPLPTHYFGVVSRCHINGSITLPLPTCHPDHIQFIAWIFPHVNDVPKCFNFDRYFRDNLATLRDVEMLTGLVFFPELSMSSDDETRLKMIKLKTLYPYNADWTGLT